MTKKDLIDLSNTEIQQDVIDYYKEKSVGGYCGAQPMVKYFNIVPIRFYDSALEIAVSKDISRVELKNIKEQLDTNKKAAILLKYATQEQIDAAIDQYFDAEWCKVKK